jgi:hypothetical protein
VQARQEWDNAHPDELVPSKFIEEISANPKRYSADRDALKKELLERVKRHYEELKKRSKEAKKSNGKA